ncbi:DUF2235 domain-containing protein [Octadecabacter sp. 1_MG-2023]|uniref:phospholipase effector Tle1 domain-containing protein n=1 Tax=unclassified Octadecabacter TaxID=196158 RepID=UPI001C08E15B|nr:MULTISPECIES: DUF2235 domain-containing protein [unclassified Octadecabacter]MBU2993754.1 DUF2235 domain-containing protein [Octadecabacter sp. B2R22]MDO6735401.1 DUF2235 domain-containing protein [Octadecabacter sp. 1_MG-2023]
MKRIAIFIDGTWNTPDAENGTNVLRLSRCVRHHDDDGTLQVVLYAPGVGSGRGNTRFGRFLDRSLGGALGWGLLEIIADLYRQLVMIYEPGDEIQLFGFSRGAFAARSFAGVLRSCGIPPRRNLHEVRGAIERYASRDPATHPEDPSSYEFRERISPDTATSAKELNWRNRHGQSGAIRLHINYIGVWDTVKALGLPEKLHISDIANARHHFHDAALSSSVISARHAIAIDEYRWTFPSLPWNNMEELNRDRNGAYLQQFFPGNHGSVGGGGKRIGLSSIALNWIAMGAAQAGLALDWDSLDLAASDFDHMADLTNKFGVRSPTGRDLKDGGVGRAGPKAERDLSLCALDRYVDDGAYRPYPLEALKDELHKMSADEINHLRTLMIERDGGETHVKGQRRRPRQKIERRWF